MKLLPHSLDDFADLLMAAGAFAAINFSALVWFDVVDGAKTFIVKKNAFGGIVFLFWRQGVDIVLDVLRTERTYKFPL